MTALREKVETTGTDAVQNFKTSQSFIDSCADYYGTGFDDCLKLDLSGISMDAPARNVIVDDDDGIPKSHPSPKVDGGVILAQPAITPHAPVSKTPVLTVNANNTQFKDSGTPADALNV